VVALLFLRVPDEVVVQVLLRSVGLEGTEGHGRRGRRGACNFLIKGKGLVEDGLAELGGGPGGVSLCYSRAAGTFVGQRRGSCRISKALMRVRLRALLEGVIFCATRRVLGVDGPFSCLRRREMVELNLFLIALSVLIECQGLLSRELTCRASPLSF
jgi:hypothetical protein